MQKRKISAFQVERLREKLAILNKIDDFKKTYSLTFAEIPDNNTPEFWDRINERKHIRWSDSPMTAQKIDIISGYITNGNYRVLNVGCGSGDLENIIFNKQKKNILKWYGVDFSKRSINSCKKEFSNAVFVVGDIRKLGFKKKEFDLIVLMEILEHIRPVQLFGVLKYIKILLKKEGKLIISIPLNEGLDEMIKKGINPNAHVRDYKPKIIETELKIAGFDIVDEKYLFAFSNFYRIKSFIVKYLLKGYREPNNMVILAKVKA